MTEDPKESVSELINPADFISLRHRITFRNLTSGGMNENWAPVQVISLAQLFDRGMLLEVPRRSCAKGHSLLIEITLVKQRTVILRFTCTGKVEELRNLGDESDELRINLIQFVDEEWKAFREKFSSRQDEIDAFFKAARGY